MTEATKAVEVTGLPTLVIDWRFVMLALVVGVALGVAFVYVTTEKASTDARD